MSSNSIGEEVEHFRSHVSIENRVTSLENQQAVVDRLSTTVDRLSANVKLLTHEVKNVCLAIGIAHHIPIPEEWEEITQVKRPELAKLRARASKGPAAAGGGVALIWLIVELLRAVTSGRVHWPW
jgi:hypothetical protein